MKVNEGGKMKGENSSIHFFGSIANKSSTKAELIYIQGIFYRENAFKIRYRRGKLRVIPFMIHLVTSVHRDFAFFFCLFIFLKAFFFYIYFALSAFSTVSVVDANSTTCL